MKHFFEKLCSLFWKSKVTIKVNITKNTEKKDDNKKRLYSKASKAKVKSI